MHLTHPEINLTGRSVSLELSASRRAFGHFGIEWDISSLDQEKRAEIAEWVRIAKRIRPLVASGRMVHVDTVDLGQDVRGMTTSSSRRMSQLH